MFLNRGAALSSARLKWRGGRPTAMPGVRRREQSNSDGGTGEWVLGIPSRSYPPVVSRRMTDKLAAAIS